jgi:hypothetical protein
MYIERILPHDWLSEWARPDPTHALTTLETVIGYLYCHWRNLHARTQPRQETTRKPACMDGDVSVRPSLPDQAEASQAPSSPQTNPGPGRGEPGALQPTNQSRGIFETIVEDSLRCPRGEDTGREVVEMTKTAAE